MLNDRGDIFGRGAGHRSLERRIASRKRLTSNPWSWLADSKAARDRPSTAAARRKLTLTLLMPKHEQGIDQGRGARGTSAATIAAKSRIAAALITSGSCRSRPKIV